MEQQLDLFPNTEPTPEATEVDTEAIARGGRTDYDPNHPVSEAARDQGHGPVELPVATSSKSARKPRPYRGRIRGESESETYPSGHNSYRPLTEGDRRIGRVGVVAARQALHR